MSTQTLNQLNGVRGGQPPLWVSGSTVAQWQLRTSPLDGEVYQRKTATGSGATDPANDLTNYTAASYVRTAAITNAWSAGAAATTLSSFAVARTNLSYSAPGNSAGVRTQMLSITGKGRIDACVTLLPTPASSLTIRTELVVDGRPLFDATNAWTSGTTGYVAATGALFHESATGGTLVIPQPIEFARTLEVYFTASITAAPYFGQIVRLRG